MPTAPGSIGNPFQPGPLPHRCKLGPTERHEPDILPQFAVSGAFMIALKRSRPGGKIHGAFSQKVFKQTSQTSRGPFGTGSGQSPCPDGTKKPGFNICFPLDDILARETTKFQTGRASRQILPKVQNGACFDTRQSFKTACNKPSIAAYTVLFKCKGPRVGNGLQDRMQICPRRSVKRQPRVLPSSETGWTPPMQRMSVKLHNPSQAKNSRLNPWGPKGREQIHANSFAPVPQYASSNITTFHFRNGRTADINSSHNKMHNFCRPEKENTNGAPIFPEIPRIVV